MSQQNVMRKDDTLHVKRNSKEGIKRDETNTVCTVLYKTSSYKECLYNT